MQMRIMTILLILMVTRGALRGEEPKRNLTVHPGRAGLVRALEIDGQVFPVSVEIRIPGKGWKSQPSTRKVRKSKVSKEGDGVRWDYRFPAQGGKLTGRTCQRMVHGSVEIDVRLTAEDRIGAEGVYCFVRVPVDLFVGGKITLDSVPKEQRMAKTAALPSELDRENFRFLGGKSSVATFHHAEGDARLRVSLDRSVVVSVQDDRRWGPAFYTALFQLHPGDVGKGETVQSSIKLSFRAKTDNSHATVSVNKSKELYRLAGLGGNFVFGVEKPITDFTLKRLPLAWARVGMHLDDWEPTNDNEDPNAAAEEFFVRRDRKNSPVRHSMEIARRLARRKVPFVVSTWWVPPHLTADPNRSRAEHGRRVPRTKWPEAAECIITYLQRMKQEYGAEPVAFSFNESDIGVFVKMTSKEHRDWIRFLGRRMDEAGLTTRMLLGDTANAGGVDFIQPTLKDKEAMRYVAAIAFHSWGGRAEQFAAWASIRKQTSLPLLVSEVGYDAQAWHDLSFNTKISFLGELRIWQQLLAEAHPSALLEWEYTDDYNLATTGRKGDLSLTARGRMIKQYGDTTPRGATAVVAASDRDNVIATAFTGDRDGKRVIVIHIANLGAERKVAVKGIADVVSLNAWRTTYGDSKAIDAPKPRRGSVDLTVPGGSLTTLVGALADEQ